MTKNKQDKKKKHAGTELIKTVLWAVVIALGIRSILFEPFNIPSGSMLPVLYIGDHLFVSKYSYGYSRHSFPASLVPFDGRMWGRSARRGDIIVFKEPLYGLDYIKRLIGLPGDIIQMRKGRLYINGEMLPREQIEDFVWRNSDGLSQKFTQYIETNPDGVQYRIIEVDDDKPLDDTREFVVPEGHYFFMGDNRDNSSDSRAAVGYVPEENLIGKAQFLFFAHDGTAKLWQIWKWPGAIRWSRFFTRLNDKP